LTTCRRGDTILYASSDRPPDAADILHHVMVRGTERRPLFAGSAQRRGLIPTQLEYKLSQRYAEDVIHELPLTPDRIMKVPEGEEEGGGEMKIEKIDHICFAVEDLEKTKKIYEENLGLVPVVEYVAESEFIKVARYYIGEVAVEFMESTSPEGEVAKFIKKKGEGVFLISYKVDDLDGALTELKARGADL